MTKRKLFPAKKWLVLITAILAGLGSIGQVYGQADFTAFNFALTPTYAETITPGNLTITVPVYNTADITQLKAVFTVPAGATVTVNNVAQTSGTTVNDFTNPVTYTVTDGGTVKNWVVTVTKNAALTDKQLLTFSFASITGAVGVIDQGNFTVDVTVPFSTDLTALVATFTSSPVSKVFVGATQQVSGTTANNFTSTVTYRVQAENGSTRNYYVTVHKAVALTGKQLLTFKFESADNPSLPSDVIVVLNEPAKTGAANVPYATDVTALKAVFTLSPQAILKVGSVVQTSHVTSVNYTSAVTFTVVAEDGGLQDYVITITKNAPSTSSDITVFDFKAASNASLDTDVVGTIDQGLKTINLTIPYSGNITQLTATFTHSTFSTVTIGGVVQTSGITIVDFTADKTYRVTAQDGTTTKDYVVHVTKAAASTQNKILTFAFLKADNPALAADINGVIDDPGKKITVNVPFSTNVTALIASFTNSPLSKVKIGNVLQVSHTTPNNFTNVVNYECEAEDGSKEIYAVTVTKLPPSPDNKLTAFEFAALTPSAVGVIDEPNKTVTVHVPYVTNVTNLVATFTISANATANIGGVVQVSGTSINSYASPVVYSIVAEDGSVELYTVTVIKDPNTEKRILSFSFQGITPAVSGAINEGTKTIQANVPFSVNRAGLVATFTLSDYAKAYVSAVQQVSGTTANDFTGVVTYTIQAQDGSAVNYQVTVLNNPVETGKSILSFSFDAFSPPVVGAIDETGKTIAATFPYGTDVTALVATFTKSYLSTVKIGAVAQVSGTSVNDFTNSVTYRCTAEDGSYNDYVVTVNVEAASSAKDMTYFAFESFDPDVVGVINQTNQTILLTIPNGTDKTNLVATFTTSDLTTVRVKNLGIQQSGITSNDFTTPLVYEVYAQDGTMKEYLVTVVETADVTAPVVSNAVQATSNLVGDYALVQSNEATGKVYIIKTGVNQTNISQLEAAVTANYGRSSYVTAANTDIAIGTFDMIPGTYFAYAIDAAGNMSAKGVNAITISDLQAPSVTVSAQTLSNAPSNSVNVQSSDVDGFVYLVMEGVAQASKPQLDAAVLANKGVKGFVSAANTDVPLPVAGLLPGNYHAYAVDFSSNVSAPSANVVVITEASRLKSVLSFSFNQVNPVAVGQISGTEISVKVTPGTSLTNLVATFTLSPLAKAYVGLVQQVSGVTANNFTNPVNYTVEAEDGTTLDYTVTVSFNTGIDDQEWFSQVKVYPNPFTDRLIIEMPIPADQIEVYTLTGQMIDQIQTQGNTTMEIPTYSWEKGVYLLRFKKEGALVGYEKVIK